MRFEDRDDFGKFKSVTSNDIRHLMDLLDGYMGETPYCIREFWRSNIDDPNGRIDVEVEFRNEENFVIRQKLLILNDEVIDGKTFHERHDEWYGKDNKPEEEFQDYSEIFNLVNNKREKLENLQNVDDYETIFLGNKLALFIMVNQDFGKKEYFIELNRENDNDELIPCGNFNQTCEFGDVDKLIQEIVKYMSMVEIKKED